MKKTNMVLLVSMIGFVLLITGCSGSKTQIVAPLPQEIVKLRVAGFKAGSEIGAIPELNDRFMKENPTIKVIYEGMPGAQYTKYIRGKFAVNDAPDVIMLHPGLGEVGGYAKAGFIKDLSGEPWVGAFTTAALESVSYEGKVYGIPNDMVVLGVYYNKDIFEKLSLKAPSNWEEFLAVCAALKSSGTTPISIGNNDGWMTLAALFTLGSSLIKDQDFDRKLNAREIKFNGTWNEILEKWYSLDGYGYLTPNSTKVSMDQAQKDFVEGRAGMFINGSWTLAGIVQGNPDFELGMFTMPANPPGEEAIVSVNIGTTWTINNKTNQLEAARKYLDFWSQEQTLRQWAKSQASFLTLQGAKSDSPKELSDISRSIMSGRTKEYLSNWWEQSGDVVNEIMDSAQGVYLHALTIDQMLNNMDSTWDKSTIKGGGSQ
ncbi:ABC transporter substrate-binding protein [Cohnella abietis]|nr:sugar ABC transporter substrate-binding protein [Cohnella abietis]